MLKAALDGRVMKMVTPLVLACIFYSCYILNIMQVAVTIALIHDSTELLNSVNMLVSKTKFKSSLLPITSGISFLAWAYARVYVLSLDVLYPTLAEPKPFLEDKTRFQQSAFVVMVVYLVFRSIIGSFAMIQDTLSCKSSDEGSAKKRD